MLMLRVGGVDEHYNLPWHLLMESGKLEEFNVELKWKNCYGGTGEMTKLLRENELDMAVLLTEGMIADCLKGNSAKILKVFVDSSLEWGVHTSLDATHKLWDKESITFAVSRMGSGSHLMALLFAQQMNIPVNKLTFKVVGSLDGAMESFAKNTVDAFLWERFTTEPYLNKHHLKRMDSIYTPWPCFVIAVKPAFYEENQVQIDRLLDEVFVQAEELKENPSAVTLISQRYHLHPEKVQQWFENVRWGLGENLSLEEVDKVLHHLMELEKISAESEAIDFGDILTRTEGIRLLKNQLNHYNYGSRTIFN